MNVFIRIALAKGEWEEAIDDYLFRSFGIIIPTASFGSGKKILTSEYVSGDYRIQFRMMRARDVPYFIGGSVFSGEIPYSYGITGLDFFDEALLRGRKGEIKILDGLKGGGKEGMLVLYGRAELPKKPKIIVREDYENLARKYLDSYFSKGKYDLAPVTGGDEGFVSSKEADAGFGLKVSGTTLSDNGLRVIDEFIGPIFPVVIGTKKSELAEFERLLKSARRK